MQQMLSFIQIGLSILLIGTILIQQRGTDLGSSFGGSSASFNTRRGIEKTLFIATIVLGILYFASALASVIVR